MNELLAWLWMSLCPVCCSAFVLAVSFLVVVGLWRLLSGHVSEGVFFCMVTQPLARCPLIYHRRLLLRPVCFSAGGFPPHALVSVEVLRCLECDCWGSVEQKPLYRSASQITHRIYSHFTWTLSFHAWHSFTLMITSYNILHTTSDRSIYLILSNSKYFCAFKKLPLIKIEMSVDFFIVIFIFAYL